MKVMTGTVVNGKIEVPPEALSEGAKVMIVAAEPGGLVRLTPVEEGELLAASEEIRRGEYVDGDDLVRDLRSRLD